MGISARRGGGWWLLLALSTLPLVAAGTGTAWAAWSEQKDTSLEASLQEPPMSFSVTTDQTYVADVSDATAVSAVLLDLSGADNAAENEDGTVTIAVSFNVDLRTSIGYTMDYSFTVDRSGPIFSSVDDPSQCVPTIADIPQPYNPGETVKGIAGGMSRRDLWCAVVSFTSGKYDSTTRATGTNAMNDSENVSSSWQVNPGSGVVDDLLLSFTPILRTGDSQ